MLYGMIDMGSNTVRMAIYELEGERVEMVMKKKHLVGLAAYVKNGFMTREGIDIGNDDRAAFCPGRAADTSSAPDA